VGPGEGACPPYTPTTHSLHRSTVFVGLVKVSSSKIVFLTACRLTPRMNYIAYVTSALQFSWKTIASLILVYDDDDDDDDDE